MHKRGGIIRSFYAHKISHPNLNGTSEEARIEEWLETAEKRMRVPVFFSSFGTFYLC